MEGHTAREHFRYATLRVVSTHVGRCRNCGTHAHERAPRAELLGVSYLMVIASHWRAVNGYEAAAALGWTRSLQVYYGLKVIALILLDMRVSSPPL
jgi:hypothetical protein